LRSTKQTARREQEPDALRLRLAFAVLLALAAWAAGCAGGTMSFLHPNVDFSHIHRCAVLPFHNLTSDSYADDRIQSIFLMEVLGQGELVLVDPEETVGAIKDLKISPASTPTPEQLVALGKALSVEAVFEGTVEEYGQAPGARSDVYFVTATFSMSETETGNLIWRAQVHKDGSSFLKKLFGGETASLYTVSRKAVRAALGSLF
jgi:hypothetical protein